MTTEQSDLVNFLLTRITEDEVVVSEGGEVHSDWGNPRRPLYANAETVHVGVPTERMAAECEAKRRIVELHDAGWSQIVPNVRLCPSCAAGGKGVVSEVGCPTLRALVLPYADHPDFRVEWRV